VSESLRTAASLLLAGSADPSSVASKAGGLLMSSTRPTLNLLLLLILLLLLLVLVLVLVLVLLLLLFVRRASERALNMMVSRAPISVECLLSMTLLPGR